MKNNSNNKTFLFINLKKFKIIVLDDLNEVIFKKELLLKPSSEKFDFVTLFHVYEHMDNPINDLKAVYSRLKKGGKTLISSKNKPCKKTDLV